MQFGKKVGKNLPLQNTFMKKAFDNDAVEVINKKLSL
jgi:hypothetical protein